MLSPRFTLFCSVLFLFSAANLFAANHSFDPPVEYESHCTLASGPFSMLRLSYSVSYDVDGNASFSPDQPGLWIEGTLREGWSEAITEQSWRSRAETGRYVWETSVAGVGAVEFTLSPEANLNLTDAAAPFTYEIVGGLAEVPDVRCTQFHPR